MGVCSQRKDSYSQGKGGYSRKATLVIRKIREATLKQGKGVYSQGKRGYSQGKVRGDIHKQDKGVYSQARQMPLFIRRGRLFTI